MFKNYLTYQFALAFHRSCAALTLPHPVRERLMRSAETMIHEFSRAVHATDAKDELKFMCVTLICLRDCHETLTEAKVRDEALGARYSVLHSRLEQICLKAAEAENGQLRMLG